MSRNIGLCFGCKSTSCWFVCVCVLMLWAGFMIVMFAFISVVLVEADDVVFFCVCGYSYVARNYARCAC